MAEFPEQGNDGGWNRAAQSGEFSIAYSSTATKNPGLEGMEEKFSIPGHLCNYGNIVSVLSNITITSICGCWVHEM